VEQAPRGGIDLSDSGERTKEDAPALLPGQKVLLEEEDYTAIALPGMTGANIAHSVTAPSD
jgi:hypothetical protein